MSTNGEQANDLTVKAAIAHHVSSYDKVCGERDDLQKINDRQEQMLTVARIEIEGLRAELAAERTRTASYQHERDNAVARSASYEAIIANINAMTGRVIVGPEDANAS